MSTILKENRKTFSKKPIKWKVFREKIIEEKIFTLFGFFSGVFLSLAMPGFNLYHLAWFALIPLIMLIDSSKYLVKTVKYSFVFGMGFYLPVLSWLLGLHSLEWLGFNYIQSIFLTVFIWLGVSLYSSCYYILFGAGAYYINKTNLNLLLKSILTVFCWNICQNKLMSLGEFAFPWGMIEYSQYLNHSLIQLSKYFGGEGIASIIILSSAFIGLSVNKCLKNNLSKKNLGIRLTSCFIFIFLLHFTGFYLLKYPVSHNKKLIATIIQGNMTIDKEKGDKNSLDYARKYYLSEIKKAPAGIIVIPETAFFELLRYDDAKLYSELEKTAFNDNKTVITGTIDLKKTLSGKILPTNSVIIFDKNIPINQDTIYNKRYIVPFGEYTPLAEIIPVWIRKFLSNAVNTPYARGEGTKIISSSNGRLLPTICYEIIFPDALDGKNTDVLVNLSNLSWFRDTIIKDQFVAFGVLRAAENQKPFIISVNTGYSVIIDYTGKIICKIPKNTNGALSEEIFIP